MDDDNKREKQSDTNLLWGCFTNWAETLEKTGLRKMTDLESSR